MRAQAAALLPCSAINCPGQLLQAPCITTLECVMAHSTAVGAVVQALRSGAEAALRRARASGAAASARLDEDLGSEPPLLAIALAAADALDAAREVTSMLGISNTLYP